MIVLALVVVGAASYFRLGVDRFPKVDLPTVSVRTDLPGASTEEVETQVSQKIEEVVNTVEGITELRSISGAGRSVVIVTFVLSRNIDVATQDVRDRVSAVLSKLPKEAKPPVIAKNDNDSAPVMTGAESLSFFAMTGGLASFGSLLRTALTRSRTSCVATSMFRLS